LVAIGASALLMMSSVVDAAPTPIPGVRLQAHSVNVTASKPGRGKDLPRTRLRTGKLIRAKPATTTATASGAGAGIGLESNYCGSCKPPLLYSQGPVMGTAAVPGQMTVYTIYWSPTGASAFSANYASIINGYVANVAADSGKTTNVYSVHTQYSGQSGVNIKYSIKAANATTPFYDVQAYPAKDQCQLPQSLAGMPYGQTNPG
jgi:hypothetical protein